MSFQKCPICNGTGIEPLSGTSADTQAKCLLCDGNRVIHTETGLPPNKISVEKFVKELPKNLKDAQINVFAEQHSKNVIEELEKTGELPFHVRPVNALKRTDEEKEQIKHERELDPVLRQVDETSSEVIVSPVKMNMYSRKGLIFHCQIKNKEFNTWVYRTNTHVENIVLSDDSGVIIPIPNESVRPLITILNDFISIEETKIPTQNPTQDVSNISCTEPPIPESGS